MTALAPGLIARRMDRVTRRMLTIEGGPRVDFTAPVGEPALTSPDSVSWRVFKNPVTLFIGGVSAVILEFAEPRVRSGVWDHSTFRADPLSRLRRTGLAAMMTVYGARSEAEAMIAAVVRRHGRVSGVTPGGQAYQANDPALLTWVHATAAYGFVESYSAYARHLTATERDRFYAEGGAAARLYGATPQRSRADVEALFAATRPSLEASPIVLEFLEIMTRRRLLPGPLGPMQGMLVRAAVEITPPWLRETLGLGAAWRLRRWEATAIRLTAAFADRSVIQSHPAVQACQRLGLPADYLYRSPA